MSCATAWTYYAVAICTLSHLLLLAQRRCSMYGQITKNQSPTLKFLELGERNCSRVDDTEVPRVSYVKHEVSKAHRSMCLMQAQPCSCHAYTTPEVFSRRILFFDRQSPYSTISTIEYYSLKQQTSKVEFKLSGSNDTKSPFFV